MCYKVVMNEKAYIIIIDINDTSIQELSTTGSLHVYDNVL